MKRHLHFLPALQATTRLSIAFIVFLFLFSGCSLDQPFILDNFARSPAPQIDGETVLHTIFLVGDAGDPKPIDKEPVLMALREQASRVGEKGTVVILGDNIYPSGMPAEESEDRGEAEARLAAQLRAIEQGQIHGIIVPGNHDWEHWKTEGLQSLLRQQAFVDSFHYKKLTFLPRDGSPGPAVVDVHEQLRIIVLDTQWWLQRGEKTFYPNFPSEQETKAKFLDSLTTLLKASSGKYVIVVGHHPLETYGPHGGFFGWKDHLFPLRKLHSALWIPLPIIGSLYPLGRNLGVTTQDLSSSEYQDFKKNLEHVFASHPPLVYATGHEHSLQILKGISSTLYAISGYGTSAHESALTRGDSTIFAHAHPGFMRLDVLSTGGVRLGVLEPVNDSGASKEVFSFWLVRPQ